MNKNIWTSLGATVLALPLLCGSAEARKASYEINGKRYTYETNDPQQVESARKRIEAANAADAARTKAEAEKTATPLVSVFGSEAQMEAANTKAHLEQVLAEQDAADAARKQERSASRKEAQPQKSSDEQARAPDADQEGPEQSQTATQAQDDKQPATAKSLSMTTTPEPETQVVAKPMVKSVSFDVGSGIKTIIMSDGSIQEEPFDTGMVEKLAFEQDSSGSLTDFVKQIRKAAPEETTGSTTRADAASIAPTQH
ncbi:hypothetical protein [Microvirga puerhi]|uniref:Uncharacterized protein n=1 Tax=Microvirga puerhi TaxID=2876078 RepID=A0ABS7VSI3_9HYPH|nr:hypothetical protein [Microvirga puerhi]MBZ6077907.1 hypothetical protein [Microvirga puerhi]